MFCKHCGEKIPADSKFCTKCGGQLSREKLENVESSLAQNQNREQVHKWSWGGFGLGWVYLAGNGAGVSYAALFLLLNFVPIVNLFAWIYLGIKGREIVWKKRKGESYEEFVSSQKTWDVAAIVVLIVFFFIGLVEALPN